MQDLKFVYIIEDDQDARNVMALEYVNTEELNTNADLVEEQYFAYITKCTMASAGV